MEKEKRSEMMRKIKSRNTLPERIFKILLRKQKISFIFQPDIVGHPDFLIKEFNCAVFVQGCFWHGCKKHYRIPKTNIDFWRNKIKRNIERHRENCEKMRILGYSVIEIWEHDLK